MLVELVALEGTPKELTLSVDVILLIVRERHVDVILLLLDLGYILIMLYLNIFEGGILLLHLIWYLGQQLVLPPGSLRHLIQPI
jgi:hypothetical protein